MSVEAPKLVQETPVTATPETTEATTVPETATAQPEAEPANAQEAVHDKIQNAGDVVVEATPASEGVLGYKEPGLLKLLKGYQKHHFWFGSEAVKPESLTSYLRSEKPELAHHNAAWAQETGKGVLFFSKREEDKATPAGMIMLSDISKITKEGETEFQFKDGHHTQKFQAATSAERDSWLVALQKESEEAKNMKEGIVGSEGYKKNLESHKAVPALAAAGGAVVAGRTAEPKKSLDASTATTTSNGVTDGAVVDEETKEAAKKDKNSRSRSRGNRKSFFGGLLDKKEKTEESKELKKEEKAEKKEEKKEIKEKKEEAALKKEEAKATHDSDKAKEAAEAAAIAAVPAAAVAEKKHEEKDVTTPTEKKAKRGSVFGSMFSKKNVTSPDAEKTEAEAGPAVPTKDSDIPPVSETAPKIEKPVDQAPLDTAAVVAPVDTVQTPAAVEEPTSKDKPTTPTEATSAHKQKEGGGFLGFIKKTESKLAGKKESKAETKEEKAAEEVAKDPVAAAAVEPTTETPATTNGEERPVNPQRRSSLMERFGAQKKANKTSETDAAPVDAKREKSPLPSRVAGLFRKPSKAVKPAEEKSAEEKSAETNGLTNGHTEPAAVAEGTTAAVPESKDAAIVTDVIPEQTQSTVHDQVTAVPEVKASA